MGSLMYRLECKHIDCEFRILLEDQRTLGVYTEAMVEHYVSYHFDLLEKQFQIRRES